MYFTVQIPFVDFRIIGKEHSDKYFFPNSFLDVDYSKKQSRSHTYYRYFGAKAIRNNNFQLPISERNFFDSHNTLKLKLENNPYNAHIIFSRLYSDKSFFHFDFGIRIESKNVAGKDIQDVISNIFSNIYTEDRRHFNNKQKIMFPMVFNYLRELYLYATTYTQAEINETESEITGKKIVFGDIGVFVNDNQNNLTYKHFRNAKLNIDNLNLKVKNGYIKDVHSYVWLMNKRNKGIIRELGICLSKLHCFRECIALTLNYLNSFRDYDLLNFEELKWQFEFFTDLYNRDSYYGHSIFDIELAAFKANLSVDAFAWRDYNRLIRYYRDIFDAIYYNPHKKNGYINYLNERENFHR